MHYRSCGATKRQILRVERSETQKWPQDAKPSSDFFSNLIFVGGGSPGFGRQTPPSIMAPLYKSIFPEDIWRYFNVKTTLQRRFNVGSALKQRQMSNGLGVGSGSNS